MGTERAGDCGQVREKGSQRPPDIQLETPRDAPPEAARLQAGSSGGDAGPSQACTSRMGTTEFSAFGPDCGDCGLSPNGHVLTVVPKDRSRGPHGPQPEPKQNPSPQRLRCPDNWPLPRI